jgi:3-phosphoshikimate 1-carboxyvinyltransferase
MGAELHARDGDRLPPVTIRGGALRGGEHALEVASAQVKSAILLAGLFADAETTVVEPHPSRDHTERMLASMGVPLRVSGRSVVVAPARPRGSSIDVPGDVSSAAFFLCAAAGLEGSELTVRNVGLNPTRTGALEVLEAMGARVGVSNEVEEGEPRGDVTVRAAPLRAVEISGALVPRLIDELPVLMVLATQARGRTVIRDARELRVKESDRLASMGEALAAAGARVELRDDGCVIEGPTPLRGVSVRTRLDHRIAMSMAVAQLFAGGEAVYLDDVGCVATSFPDFFAVLDRLAGGAR